MYLTLLFKLSFCYHLCLGCSDDSNPSSEFDFEAHGNHNNDRSSSDDGDWTTSGEDSASGLENLARVEGPGILVNPQYKLELQAGDPANLLGTNQHHFQPGEYPDFGRRFVPQYPYTENIKGKNREEELLPQLAPPELVLAIARESALLEAANPINPTDEIIRKDILRTGEYWNGVWKEDVNPKKLLRSHKNAALRVLNVNIKPGSELYELAMKLKRISPRLLYIVNKEKPK